MLDGVLVDVVCVVVFVFVYFLYYQFMLELNIVFVVNLLLLLDDDYVWVMQEVCEVVFVVVGYGQYEIFVYV